MPIQMIRIDVSATVIFSGTRLLTVYNERWGAFTLPMTKLRRRPLDADKVLWERGDIAAVRNVAECLGTTTTRLPVFLMDSGKLARSTSDGKTKHYAFQIFAFEVSEPSAACGLPAEWLTADEILDPAREPVSPTARSLVAGLQEAALGRGGRFPPQLSGPITRSSSASLAVISRTQGHKKEWLTQWNEKWQRYFLVGGHTHTPEIPEQTMRRELEQELGLDQHVHYELYPRKSLSYEAWSTGSWQMTQYDVAVFDVELKPPAMPKIEADAANRWVRADEILSECCDDGKLVSSTTRMVLSRLGET